MNSDTDPFISKIQLDIMRKASPEKKLAVMRSLSSTVMGLAKGALERANPHLDNQGRTVLFVKHHYGEALAIKLQGHLNRLNNGK